jgi:RNA polymerase sigma-70 factor (ECF subfamily)
LRSGFDTSFVEIGAIVASSEVACRKLFSRAAKKLTDGTSPTKPVGDVDKRLLARLVDAVRRHDEKTVSAVLALNVRLLTNAGKGGTALARPLVGPAAVARFAIRSLALIPGRFKLELTQANGLPMAIVIDVESHETLFALLMEPKDGAVVRLFAISDARRLPRRISGIAVEERKNLGSRELSKRRRS